MFRLWRCDKIAWQGPLLLSGRFLRLIRRKERENDRRPFLKRKQIFVICEENVLQTLFYALLISDIGVNLSEYGDFRTVACRNMKSGLPHEGEKSDRF